MTETRAQYRNAPPSVACDPDRARRALPELARVLGKPEAILFARSRTLSFVGLGGTSLLALQGAMAVERATGLRVDVAALLDEQPLADVLARAAPAPPAPPEDRTPALTDREPSDAQLEMLHTAEVFGSAPYHLLFSVDVHGPVTDASVERAVHYLTLRHESLRTYFPTVDGRIRRRVLPDVHPRIVFLPLGTADDAASTVERLLEPTVGAQLLPEREPAVVWTVSRVSKSRLVVSLAIHHVLADGWSVGLLLREFVERLAENGHVCSGPAPGVEERIRRSQCVATSRVPGALADLVRSQLGGVPWTVELPTDHARPDTFDGRGQRLAITLDPDTTSATVELASATGVTTSAVLLAAWTVAISRMAGVEELVVGVPVSGRPTPELAGVVGLCTRVAPLVCRVDPAEDAVTLVRRSMGSLREGLDFSDIDFGEVVAALAPPRSMDRPTLVQIGFAAHAELIDREIVAGGIRATVHEGHGGGSAFDAILYLQHLGERAELALEYALAALDPADAARLAEHFIEILSAMVRDPRSTVGAIASAACRLPSSGSRPPASEPADLWQRVAAHAVQTPQAVAVRDGGRTVTYRELVRRAEEAALALIAQGVTEGDVVGIGWPRGVDEVVWILATARLGAAYTALPADMPAGLAGEALARAGVRWWVGPLHEGAAGVTIVDPDSHVPVPLPDPRPLPPGAVASVLFTSGSTGVAKGVRVPVRAISALVDDERLVLSDDDRMLRLAPLAFDASTLEIWAPLVRGACIVVFPDQPVTPASLRRELARGQVTTLWLTSGLFRIVAEHDPGAFASLSQVFTGGDIVSPEAVRQVLTACAGLRVSNGYGPTECTVFVSLHSMSTPPPPDETVPIGRPIAATDVLIVDGDDRPVPWGAVGSLLVGGMRLSQGYAGDSEATASAFLTLPDGSRWYRTGDLVRWDSSGRLRFRGRRDSQVKLAGQRVDLAVVERRLRRIDGVRDAVVGVPAASDAATRRLVAGVVADRAGLDADDLRRILLRHLPPAWVPTTIAVVDSLPLSTNGKVDIGALERSVSPTTTDTTDAAPSSGAVPHWSPRVIGATDSPSGPRALRESVRAAWQEVLGRQDVGDHDGFFDLGGTSLQLARLRSALRTRLDGTTLGVADLMRHHTVAAQARALAESDRR